jgi:hypothetical protein
MLQKACGVKPLTIDFEKDFALREIISWLPGQFASYAKQKFEDVSGTKCSKSDFDNYGRIDTEHS